MTRARLLVALAVLGTGVGIAGTASAASPAYCALYAREYATGTVQPQAAPGMLESVQDQAYYRCLNQDLDPPLPQQSAYAGTDLRTLTNPGAGAGAAAAGSSTTVASLTIIPPMPKLAPTPPAASASPAPAPAVVAQPSAPAASAPAAPAQVVKAKVSTAPYHGSGLTPWTPAWTSWCAANFPNSWDPKTGTILHYDSDVREQCK